SPAAMQLWSSLRALTAIGLGPAKPPSPLPIIKPAVVVLLRPTRKSNFPSILKSATAPHWGAFAIAVLTAAAKPPAPLPARNDMLPPEFGVTMSVFPSELKSPRFAEEGPTPVENWVPAPKVDVPLPSAI